MNFGNDEMQIFAAMHFKELLRRFVATNQRPDGRRLNQIRPVHITPSPLSSTSGSVIVGIGSTRMLAGCSVEPGPASPVDPGEGRIQVTVSLAGHAATGVEAQRVREKEQTISAFLLKILLSTRVLDLKQFFVADASFALVLNIDIACMSNDGNVMDTSMIAMLATLRTAEFPIYQPDESGKVVPRHDLKKWKPTVSNYPVSLTFGLFDNAILHDCTHKEEQELTGWYSVVYNNLGQLCGMYKPGGTPIKKDSMKECMAVAKLHAKKVHQQMLSTIPAA